MLLHRQNVAGPNYIAGLTPAAWFRYAQGITVTGSGITQWDDAAGTTRFLSLPGVAGNHSTTPDSVAASITGDIDIRIDLALVDYTPTGAQGLLSKMETLGQYSYDFYLNVTTGVLIFRYSTDGTNLRTATSSAATGITDGDRSWVRATYANATGKVNFYKSTDGSSWSAIGTEQTITSGTIFDGTDRVIVGGGAAGAPSGKIYRASIYSTIGGATPVVDFNPDLDGTSGATSMTSSATGEVWTVNQTSTNNPARLCKGNALAMGVAANRPIGLLHTGTNYLYLPGVAGNYASTPDSAANSQVGNIDIQVKVALLDWSPAATNMLVGKTPSAGNYAYDFAIDVGGAPLLRYSTDGTALKGAAASANVAFTDGDIGYVRATLDVSTGDIVYYTSSDGVTWAQLGLTRSTVAGAIFNSTGQLEVGGRASGTVASICSGKIYRASIYSTIGGTTPVVDFNPALATDQAATFVASTGETWTINTSGSKPAQIVARSSILFDGAAHYLKTAPFTLNQPVTYYILAKVLSWTANDRLWDGNAVDSVTMAHDTASPQMRLNAGSALSLMAPSLGAYHVIGAYANGASSGQFYDNNSAITGNAGANNPGGFTLCAHGAGLVQMNAQILEAIIFPTAHDATTRARVIQYLNFVGNLGI